MQKGIVFKGLKQYSLLSSTDLEYAINIAPTTYKTFYIEKKNGRKREISQPSATTKMLQYYLLEAVFEPNVSFHEKSFAYRKGLKSPLLENAKEHTFFKFTLHLDIKNFFPSISPDVFFSSPQISRLNLSPDDMETITKICFKKVGSSYQLTIGAPTSPIISDIVMNSFDHKISTIAHDLNCSYSRYADDLWFSSNGLAGVNEIETTATELLSELSLPFSINKEKTFSYKEKEPRRITGLTVVNNAVKVPRHTKRIIKSLIFKESLTKEEHAKLLGYISFLRDNEPSYINNLVLKYGKRYDQAINPNH